jgi:hypothetical protein
MGSKDWRVHNAAGSKRVIVTKELPGERWPRRKVAGYAGSRGL